jgi:hypothetical protein
MILKKWKQKVLTLSLPPAFSLSPPNIERGLESISAPEQPIFGERKTKMHSPSLEQRSRSAGSISISEESPSSKTEFYLELRFTLETKSRYE